MSVFQQNPIFGPINKETTKKREALKDQINTMEIKKVNLCTDLRNTNYSISSLKATIDDEEKNLVSLREQATAALERQFEHKEITKKRLRAIKICSLAKSRPEVKCTTHCLFGSVVEIITKRRSYL